MDNIQTALIIKELCKKQKVTISRMLLDTSIRKGLIYDMEKRDLTPSAEVLEKIADYFDCSVDYLLGRTDTVDIPATTQFNGNNNGLQTTVNTGTVTIHSQTEHDDLTEMEQELLKVFRQLSFKEKIQLMDKLIIKNEV